MPRSSSSATRWRSSTTGWSASSQAPSRCEEGEPGYANSPTEVGTGKAKDEKAPLSELIEVLNERFGTAFNEEDRLFFQQIKEKACHDDQVVKTALANPLDKFQLGVKKLVEELMIERMGENDAIVTRYILGQGVPRICLSDSRAGDLRKCPLEGWLLHRWGREPAQPEFD